MLLVLDKFQLVLVIYVNDLICHAADSRWFFVTPHSSMYIVT